MRCLKKRAAALRLKTDSLVVESNVYFPPDYNLLWNSTRKCIDLVTKLQEKQNLPGWQKLNDWRNGLKNKMRPSVDLGKKASITASQQNLIADYQLMEHQADSEIVPELASRLCTKYSIASWSFDKGYRHKNNKALLAEVVDTLVLPKKRKCNKEQAEQERRPLFKKLRHQHGAVEPSINELEHRGLNRCPDRGFPHFKRYIGLAASAYNPKKIRRRNDCSASSRQQATRDKKNCRLSKSNAK